MYDVNIWRTLAGELREVFYSKSKPRIPQAHLLLFHILLSLILINPAPEYPLPGRYKITFAFIKKGRLFPCGFIVAIEYLFYLHLLKVYKNQTSS